MILPNNIRYLRKKRNWSQEHLAKLLGYKSFTTIQKWETGVSEPPLKKAHALADLFGVDIDILTKVDLEHEQIPSSSLNQRRSPYASFRLVRVNDDGEEVYEQWHGGVQNETKKQTLPLGAATLTDRSAGLFASNLMYIMSQRNTTPDAVANRVSRMDSSTIHDFLSLDRTPTTEDVEAIARLFDILPERMLNTDIEADNRLRKRKADYHRLLGSFGIPKRRDFLCEDLSSRARRFRFIERLLMYGATPDEIEERAGLSDTDMDLCFQGRIHRIDSNKVYRLACEIDTNDQYLLLNSNDPYCYETDKEGRLNGIPEGAEEELEGIDSQELLYGIWTDSKKEIYDDPKEMQRILAIMDHRDSYDNEFESLKPVLSKLNRLDLFYREHALSMISRFLDWYTEDPLDEYDREDRTNSD